MTQEWFSPKMLRAQLWPEKKRGYFKGRCSQMEVSMLDGKGENQAELAGI